MRRAVLLALLLVGCSGSSREPGVRLAFRPNAVALPALLPGVVEREVVLTNLSDRPAKDVRLATTCGCLKLLSPEEIAEIPARGRTTVRFRLNPDRAEPIEQSIHVTARNSRFQTSLGIRAEVRPVFPDLPQGPVFRRSAPSVAAPDVPFSLAVDPAVTDVRLRPTSEWLVADGRLRNGRFEGRWSARPGAPEGPFSVVVEADHRTATGEGSSTFVLRGQVRSEVVVEPIALSLGVLSVGETGRATCRVRAEGDLRAVPSGPNLRATLRRVSPGEWEVSAALTPRARGETTAQVRLLRAGRPLAEIPVSVFVP